MIEFRQIGDSDILEFVFHGKFTREDFDRVSAKIEQMVGDHGRIRLLEIVRDIDGMEPAAIWEDLKFAPKHAKDISRAAVVADQKWVKWSTSLVAPFLSAEVRHFPMNQVEEARAWLYGPPPTPH